ncbi:hypothetical protein [Paracraurococcus lichenis]|uniref:DUF2937 family protein n=1 Tax=Paracraurococcus lichenis TaxID=3064888 RepID=A0ABT9E9C7_9PROT|nr:hypothetical protein [Paracraurococcus sp. LOR1-02]MDO9712802.1 hypothetical protein [Paracraurococcus sp. LOR1-02]
MREAQQWLVGALGRDGIRDTDARWFIGALAAAVTAVEAHGRRLDRLERDLLVALERLLQGAEERLKAPYTPEERRALRAEVVQAAAGAMPGQEERDALARSLTAAVERVLTPLAERAQSPALTAAAPPSAEEQRRLLASGARLAVAQALTPAVVGKALLTSAGWVAGIFCAGGLSVVLLAGLARAVGWW